MSEADAHTNRDALTDEGLAASVRRFLTPVAGGSILDLGPGPGSLPMGLRQQIPGTIVVADPSDPNWVSNIGSQHFDAVTLLGVLEGGMDAELVLAAVLEHHLLSDGGFVVLSVMNAANERTARRLRAGRLPFGLAGTGQGQPTRWFSRESLTVLCERQGFAVSAVDRLLLPDYLVAPPHEPSAPMSLDGQTERYVFRIAPMTTDVHLVQLRQEVGRLDAELARSSDDIRRLETEVARLQELRTREIAERDEEIVRLEEDNQRLLEAGRLRDRVGTDRQASARRVHVEFRAAREEVERSRAEVRRLEQKLDMVHSSTTWKVGRALLRVPLFLRRLLRR